MKIRFITKLVLALFILIVSHPVNGKVFVDWKAEYYINYPDEWHQISYKLVDSYLIARGISIEDYDYSAVLAQEPGPEFYESPSVFVSFISVGNLNNAQIDSVLTSIGDEYGNNVRKTSLMNDGLNLLYEQPIYDRDKKAVVTKSELFTAEGVRALLDMRKFFKNGIAIFLCYDYKMNIDKSVPTFLSILNSFSTENLHEIAPADSFKVVDLSDREIARDTVIEVPVQDQQSEINSTYIIIAAIIILAVVIGMLAIKRK
jgi:hypothetical protein